jgi:CelD/BcsL family acetyltransferase involved in cellulose biosynthesis
MNVVASRSFNHDTTALPAADGRLARVEVFHHFVAAEPHWRALERAGLATPYQAYDLLRLWHRHIGAAEGVSPFIVVGFSIAGEPLFLWPLGLRQRAGLKVVEFLGGKHANFNMALWRRNAAVDIGAADLRSVLDGIGDRADLAMLSNQPMNWAGVDNPFALLPHQPSPSFGYSGALKPDFEALFNERTSASARKKMRRKERILAEGGEVRFQQAADAAEIRAVLDDFFAQKTARTRAIGLPDVFADPGVREFIQAAAEMPTAAGGPLIELYTLSVAGVIVATIGGIVADGRFSGMFLSIIHGRYAAESPGEQLLVHMVRLLCERGLHTFDLGIGEAKYKGLFCPDAEPMFDSYWPLSPAGRRVAFVFSAVAAVKRAIKQQPALWSLVLKWRRLRARLTKKPSSNEA